MSGPSDLVMRRMDSSPIPLEFARPHRHDLNEIMVVRSGHGHHVVDGSPIAFQPSSICYLPRNHMHVLEPLSGMEGWLVQFSEEFLPTDVVDRTWNYRTVLADLLDVRDSLSIRPPAMDQIDSLLELMEQSYLSDSELRAQSLRHWLALLVISVTEIARHSSSPRADRASDVEIAGRFTRLLDDEFTCHHDVGYYCASLGVSAERLSRAVSAVLGSSTKRAIDDRIVLGAKRRLLYGDESIKQIASRLGYTDQFHFSKTFKRIVGQSPSEFRHASRT